MKIAPAQQLRELDALTMKEQDISSLQLMERAAHAVTEEIARRWSVSHPVMVFAGPGNNGGDGLAVARQLSELGYQVRAYLFNTAGTMSADCKENCRRLREFDGEALVEVTTQFDPPAITADTVVVDALFGTGLTRVLSGGFASLVKYLNATEGHVVSADMPSGLMCEDNSHNVRAHIIQAELTLTFQLPKIALLLADNQTFVGELKVLDIGLSQEGIDALPAAFSILSKEMVQALLRPRPAFGHKGTFGHGLIIAGRFGMAGAAILAARACLRSGVGKVTVHTPLMNNDILQTQVPEAILSHDNSDTAFETPINGNDYSAVAVGPAIGTTHETALAFIEQVRHTTVPLIIDADGLNILSTHKGWMQQLPKETILTPHSLEFRRIGLKSNDAYSTLLEAREMATQQGLYILIKGHYTAICLPNGQVLFNPTGNSGMATAGSGDVLTGILTSLLSQGYSQAEACILGTYLHGLAGDLAAEALTEEAVTASDIIDYLPAAFKSLRRK